MTAYTQVLNATPARRLAGEIQEALGWSETASFAVSFVRMTGLQLLLPKLRSFADRGGTMRVLTSTYMDVTEPQALRSLLAHDQIDTRLITPKDAGFHSKAYLFTTAAGREQAWIGSSNLTKGGLSTNLEWNLSTRDPASCRETKDLFETLWASNSSTALNSGLIDAYERFRRQRIASGFVPNSPDGLGEMALPLAAEAPPAMWSPNELQLEGLAGLRQVRANGARRALVIAATGIGKTLLAAFDAAELRPKRLLFVAHRKDILVQAERAFRAVLGFDPKNVCMLFENESPGTQDFVFATTSSLLGLAKRGHRLLESRFDYVVVDEFHHAGAPSWRTVLGKINSGFLLGLTATPERTDGRDILELCDFNVAYEVRLPQAIERKILIPFHYFGIPDEHFTEERVPWRNGRFDPEALEEELELPERVENLIKNASEKGFDGAKRVAIGFCQSLKHANYMAAQFEARKIEAAVLAGADDRAARDTVYARLQDPTDPLEWLFVVDLLNEGVDLPAINVIAMLRPTESISLFLQQLGRGLRTFPGTEVLTVLDFVGTHRKAFLPLEALNDPSGVLANADPVERELKVSAPPFCEFLLEDRTVEILKTVKERSKTRKDKAKEAYAQIKQELGRPPRPIDFWGRIDQPSFTDVRNAFRGWRRARIELEDAAPWEQSVAPDSPLDLLMSRAEANWQQSRVTAYAALWGALGHEDGLVPGYQQFFEDHPQWTVERDAAITEAELHSRLEGELPTECWSTKGFPAGLARELKSAEVRTSVRERMLPTLADDYRRRHGGVLRTPDALRLFGTYDRAEAVNHFGVQFDPARHNAGFFEVAPRQFVIFSKLDTSGAKKQFQYENALRADLLHFEWSSQNKQRRDNPAGKAVTEHKQLGNRLFLFVQPRSHAMAVFLGEVQVESLKGDAPMRVVFRLPQPVPGFLADETGLTRKR